MLFVGLQPAISRGTERGISYGGDKNVPHTSRIGLKHIAGVLFAVVKENKMAALSLQMMNPNA